MMSSCSTAGVLGPMLADLIMLLTGMAAAWTNSTPQVECWVVQAACNHSEQVE